MRMRPCECDATTDETNDEKRRGRRVNVKCQMSNENAKRWRMNKPKQMSYSIDIDELDRNILYKL